MATNGPAQETDPRQIRLIRQHLREVLESRAFAGSKRAQDFLTLLVDHALAGQFDRLRERMIGAEMFGRPIDYDTANDSVVRVKATEVRRKLAQFYGETEKNPEVRIEVPSGTYVPRFSLRKEPDHSLDQGVPAATPREIVVQEPEPASKAPSPVPQEEGRRFRGQLRLHDQLALALLGIGILAVLVFAGIRVWRGYAVAGAESHSIVILPLQNLPGDPGQDFFADGLTEELIGDLGQVSGLRVVSRTSAMSYRGTNKSVPQIARELSVRWVVEGSVQRQGNQLRLAVRLIDAETDHPVWTHSYIRDVRNVLVLQGELAQTIADKLSVEVNPQTRARLTGVRAVKTQAEDLYLQGMQYLKTGNSSKAADYFERAIAADPTFAQPHAALADANGWMGEAGSLAYSVAFSRQKAEANRAIELDDALAEGHAQLANAAMNLDWDWATAEREFQRALDLNPGSVSIRMRYAIYLLRTGSASGAIAEVERCMKLDPLSERLYGVAEAVYYFSRQYDKALWVHNDGVARNLGLNDDHLVLGAIYEERGMYEKAIAEFQIAAFQNGVGNPHGLGHLGNAYARAGQAKEARKAIDQLKDHVRRDGIGQYEIALVYAGLGERDEAFAWLEKSATAQSEGLTNLKIDPCLDPLRSDPRFNNFVKRAGLPL